MLSNSKIDIIIINCDIMKNRILNLLVGCLVFAFCAGSESGSGENKSQKEDKHEHIVQKVSFQDVIITDNFWQPKIEINRMVGIRNALKQSFEYIEGFDIAAGKKKGKHQGGLAGDSNVYKIIEGAAYALHHKPDAALEATIDSLIDRIVAAQQPDGYLFTYWISEDISKRWKNIKKDHELYCAGHLIEAAVAWHQVTGKRKLLDAAIRFADYIDSVFGPGKITDVSDHEEIELALYKLYKITGEEKYLKLCTFFVDERGNPQRMVVEKITPPDKDPNANTPNRWRPPSYMQDHIPVTHQYYAVGHAVRAGYLYSAITDLASEMIESKYLPALDSIWNDMVGRKMYITGGVGTRQFHDEGFGSAFLLPNDQAYCETCSSVALNFWNRRMNFLHADAKYADYVELTMYNSVISGLSHDGDKTFYTNPLESNGKHQRYLWHDPPCCPTNLVRFLPEIGSTIYGKTDHEIYINQFIGSEAKITIGDCKVSLKMETEYPWEGIINLNVDPEMPVKTALYVRIPGWAQGELLPGKLYNYTDNEDFIDKVKIQVNGAEMPNIRLQNGYAVLNRKWKIGDKVKIELPMNVRMIAGNPKLEAAAGKVVMMRGPVVYCIEEVDNKTYFGGQEKIDLLPQSLKAETRKDMLNGLVILKGQAVTQQNRKVDITAIPYYAWCNREQGQMRVWLPYSENL